MAFHQECLGIEQPAIGQLIRELRQTLKLTQAKFAVQLGVSFPTINRWENGHAMPSPLALRQLETLLNQLSQSPRRHVTGACPSHATEILSRQGARSMRAEEQKGMADDLFAENGETSALLRSHDWSQTPLGAIETWSESLKTAVQSQLAALNQAQRSRTGAASIGIVTKLHLNRGTARIRSKIPHVV